MFIAKVVGNVWATAKHKGLNGLKLLLVKPYDVSAKKAEGETILAVDRFIDAGPGDIVLIMDEGNSARQILKDKSAPIRTIVCGIVDEAVLGGNKYKFA